MVLLDHAEKPGKKILISGGGRCNFTNLHTCPENFLSANPHFAKSALARYPPSDFVALVEKHGIRYHEKTLGQLFCDGSAQQIVTMLTRECTAAHVEIALNTEIRSVRKSNSPSPGDAGSTTSHFQVETSRGAWRCTSLVIATGGLSIPKMGATSFGYQIARQFGLGIVDTRPALVPFVLAEQDRQRWCDLAGLSADVIATITSGKLRTSFREKLLVTHRGLSGPVALQTSSYWRPGDSLSLDLAPDLKLTAPLRAEHASRTSATALNTLRSALPTRLAERWLAHNPPPNWTNTGLDCLEHTLHNWQLTPADTEGYAKAEVTVGGVDTQDLDAKTMQSRRCLGLYFIGEVVDVTGWLGGYNFQWAWASGAAAGRAV